MDCCQIIELRQYTLRTGQRDPLIELFDQEFVETQEADGIRVIGQFRDLDAPDRFVWLRGFQDMQARGRSLANFYGGPTWKGHRSAANATMIDSDNVLLLRPVHDRAGFDLADRSRGLPLDDTLLIATIHYLDADSGAAFAVFFETEMKPRIETAGAAIIATLMTDDSPNSFPPLPLREGEHVFVYFSRFDDASSYQSHVARLARAEDWRQTAPPGILRQLMRKPEVLRLGPTSRSLLR